MSNPLLNLLGGGANNSFMSKIAPMLGMLKGNPNAAIQSMIQNNPQANEAWKTVQNMTKGKSNKEIESMVNELANKNGVNINDLKSFLKK